MNIPFFTPICFSKPQSIKERLIEKVDDYFYLGGKKVEIVRFDKDHLIQNKEGKESLLRTVVKIATYCTVIIPAILLIIKFALRSHYTFSIVDFDKRLDLSKQVSSAEELDKKVIGSTSDTAKIKLNDGSELFWKASRNIGDGLASYREVAGSRIASYLTGNLVPVATETSYKDRAGVSYPWTAMNSDWFKALNGPGPIDFSSLNELQTHQLFVHILTDRLISNWDTHNHQYAMDEKGNIISFDKEMAFEGFFLRNDKGERVPSRPFKRTKKEPITRVAMDENHWRFTADEMAKFRRPLKLINSEFVRQVKENRIKINLDHPVIRDFFEKCDNIQKEQIVEMSRVFGKRAFGDKEDAFYNLVYNRIHHFRAACHNYFGWDKIEQEGNPIWEDESIFASIKSLDHDFNAQFNVYPVTNELGIEEVKNKLKTKERPEQSLHIGFSGYYNFDVAHERKSDYILCLDISNGTKAFYKTTEKLMAISASRLEFVDKLAAKMVKKPHKYYPNPNYNHRTVLADQVKEKLLSTGWLSQDDSFEWIKQKYSEKKIAFIRVDMRDAETFKAIERFIGEKGLKTDTLYVANIFDWLSWEAQGILDFKDRKNEQHIVDATQNIKRIISDNTQIIDATNKTGMSAATQFLTSGKEFDPIGHRERDGGISLPH